MFFSSKPTLLLVLHPTGLVIYDKKGEVATLQFADGLVRYQEVQDEKTLRESVGHLLAEHHLEDAKFIILLSDELTFQKIIPRAQAEVLQGAEETFLAMIPFAAGQRQVTSLRLKDHLVLLGAGTSLYRTVLAGVEAAKGKVVTVTVLGLYGIKTATLSAHQAQTILAETNKTTLLNLLRVEVPQPKQVPVGNTGRGA